MMGAIMLLPEAHYGPRTKMIGEILHDAANVKLFRRRKTDRDSMIRYATELIAMFPEFQSNSANPVTQITLVEGPLGEVCAQEYVDDPYSPWGDSWKTYETYLGKCGESISNAINSSPYLGSLIKPPLWAFNVRPVICGMVLLPWDDELAEVLAADAARDQAIARALLSRAENHVWCALENELVRELHPDDPNVFAVIVKLYRCGVFPLGFRGHEFILYQYSRLATSETEVRKWEPCT
jgi:hypothetical protein